MGTPNDKCKNKDADYLKDSTGTKRYGCSAKDEARKATNCLACNTWNQDAIDEAKCKDRMAATFAGSGTIQLSPKAVTGDKLWENNVFLKALSDIDVMTEEQGASVDTVV